MLSDLQHLSTRRSAYLTIPEAAELLRVSQRTLFRWMREGRLKCFRVGNITRIATSDMDTFIRNYTKTGDSHEERKSDNVDA